MIILKEKTYKAHHYSMEASGKNWFICDRTTNEMIAMEETRIINGLVISELRDYEEKHNIKLVN